MSAEPIPFHKPEPQQLPLIEVTATVVPDKLPYGYSYRDIQKRIPEILDRHRLAIAQAIPTLNLREIPEQARTLFGHFLEKKQRDALGLSFEVRALTTDLVQKNTLVAFYLRYLEEKKLFLALGYRSFKDYALNYFNELEYSYLTRLKRIAYLSEDELKTYEPLGTTKMMLLAQLDRDERQEILHKRFPVHENEYKNVVDMTTRELGRVVQKHKNPEFQHNLLKGVPNSLLHQLRLLQANLDLYDRTALIQTKEHLEAILAVLEQHLKSNN